MNDLVIGNIGQIVSGDVEQPLLPGDTVVVRDGKIAAIGQAGALDTQAIEHTIDAGGCQLWPGLIDSHTHPVVGDYTPRQQTLGFIESGLDGGVGLSGIYKPEYARPMVEWAHGCGMTVMMHIGGASIPGSNVLGAREALAIGPDIASHTNGGPTAAPLADIERLIVESQMMIEVVQAGNTKRAGEIAKLIARHGALHRMMIGTDTPSGTGVIPLGVLRTMAWVASLGEVAPELTVAMASGNTARIYKLAEGVLKIGNAADLLLVDAPIGSEAGDALAALAIGDTPAVAVAIIDGVVRVYGSRNTPGANRTVRIPWMTAGGH